MGLILLHKMEMGHRLHCVDRIERHRAGHHQKLRNPGIESSFQRWRVHRATQCPAFSASLSRLCLYMVLIVLLRANQVSAGTLQRLEKRQTLCPPGQFLNMPTSDRMREVCTPCPPGTFTEFPNGLPSCIQCQICKTDQEEIISCNATHNTKCQCKSGTFCPKEHPCEICKKCTSECPKGMVKKNDCSPSNDLECQEETGTRNDGTWIPAVIVGAALLILFIAVVIFKVCHQWKTDSQGSRNSFSIKSYLVSLLQRDNHPRQSEARGDELEERGEHQEPLMKVETSKENGYQLEQAEAMISQAKRRTLCPANGDPIRTLQKSFVIFAREVPWEYWNPYMIQLGLSQNEIMMAKESKNGIEYPHQMLTTWQQKIGKAATVDILLETLSKIKQEAARDLIQEELIRERLYVYKESEAEKSD